MNYPSKKITREITIFLLFNSLFFLLALSPFARQLDIKDFLKSPPPAPFVRLNKLVDVPSFIPGQGTLYVDPSTLPHGPFLGYDREGNLVNIITLMELDELNQQKNFFNIGKTLPRFSIDHVDITFNQGHAGFPEPHYLVIQWIINHEKEQKRMGKDSF